MTRTIIRLSCFALAAAFVGGLSMSAQALAQTACTEGRTAGGACVNGGLARSMRNRALILTQPKLSYTGAPASQSRGERQDTGTPRLIEGAYDKYGPPPPQPVPAVIGGFPLPGGFP
ncbi:hypothetical protein AC629_11070 [Bradyrhizobium sp. NAS80.1]|nr:hypothetical protein AC629_11070 [Bradyrhizobium sp. NAS80.1]